MSTFLIPPFYCPVSPGDHLWFRPSLIIEARNRRLDVDPFLHFLGLASVPMATRWARSVPSQGRSEWKSMVPFYLSSGPKVRLAAR